eukprot:c24031_g1_i1 orf=105-2123(+)
MKSISAGRLFSLLMEAAAARSTPCSCSAKLLHLLFAAVACCWIQYLVADAACLPPSGCETGLAYYQVPSNLSLQNITTLFQTTQSKALLFNTIPDPDVIPEGTFLYVPFPCACYGSNLGYTFLYEVQPDETVEDIAGERFKGLSRQDWIETATPLNDPGTIFPGFFLKVPVNCSCGDPKVSLKYGLFTTYVVQENDTLDIIGDRFNTTPDILRQYNRGTNWGQLTALQDIVFVPFSGRQGVNYTFNTSELAGGNSNTAAIIGGSVGGGVALLAVAALGIFCCCLYFRRKKHGSVSKDQLAVSVSMAEVPFADSGTKQGIPRHDSEVDSKLSGSSKSVPSSVPDFTVDKSVEFSYEELAAATDNFSANKKIGEGGYGSVYCGVLRGQKLAIKRMNLQATREFMAELKVLTHVHHTNLVQLIGFCTVESLFLVYEFVDNGTLSQHLHGSEMPPLSWAARVQIALDAARGLEYIHEHTKPTYIHRDVKSNNILIDTNFHAKVADFGLTKLTESGVGSFSMTQPTRLVGTFGYMSPEYARFGDVSPKVDVYSFGVVLFEIISAKEAIVRSGMSSTSPAQFQDQKGLVTLFEAVLMDANGMDKLKGLVDPKLGDNYPLDSVWKMALLAGACTQDNPELRPNMRAVVVALMTLLSFTQDWEVGSYGVGDQVLGNLVSM